MVNKRVALENKVKSGDLIFIRRHYKGGTAQVVDVGVAVWLRDPQYTSKLLFANVKDGSICMTTLASLDGFLEIVRPDVNFHHAHKNMIERESHVNNSVTWIVEGLNKFSLLIGNNHSPDSLYSELTTGFRWPIISLK